MSELLYTPMLSVVLFVIGWAVGSVLADILLIPFLERYSRERKKHR